MLVVHFVCRILREIVISLELKQGDALFYTVFVYMRKLYCTSNDIGRNAMRLVRTKELPLVLL